MIWEARYAIKEKDPDDAYSWARMAAHLVRLAGEIILADCPHCGHECLTPSEVVSHDEQALCVGGSERFQS